MRKIIQVGVGGMGTMWTDCVVQSRHWEPAAYVDTNRKNLMAAATRHRLPRSRCFTHLGEALGKVEADAVLDVTPQEFRREVCCAAFARGLHVLAEKPLADSVANAKAIVTEAEVRGSTFMVAQNYRFQVLAQTVRRFIASGRLGEVGYVGVTFQKAPHFGGYRDRMPYPLVLDMSIHHVDLMRCLLDSDVHAVAATGFNPPWSWYKGDAGVMAQFVLDSGVPVNYFGCWVCSGWETPWNGNWRFEGSKGVLLWENDQLSFSCKPGSRRKVRSVNMATQTQMYLLDAFARALDTREEPETSGRRNLNSLAATHAVVRAAQEMRLVNVTELVG